MFFFQDDIGILISFHQTSLEFVNELQKAETYTFYKEQVDDILVGKVLSSRSLKDCLLKGNIKAD